MKGHIALAFVAALGAAYSFSQTAPAANGTDHLGPYAGGSLDNGTAGPWADDTFDLSFNVHDNGDGTFDVRVQYKGTFVTLGGPSPSSGVGYDIKGNHGSTVIAGIQGNMNGWLTETVTSATYNPSATGFTTRSGAIAAFFPGATGETFKTWNFEYDSSDKRLKYRHWQDKSADNGQGEQFVGDIATN